MLILYFKILFHYLWNKNVYMLYYKNFLHYLCMYFHHWLYLIHNSLNHKCYNHPQNILQNIYMSHHHCSICCHKLYHLILLNQYYYIYKLKEGNYISFWFNLLKKFTCARIFIKSSIRHIISNITCIAINGWISRCTCAWSIIIATFIITCTIISFCGS